MSKELQIFKQQEVTSPELNETLDSTLDSSSLQTTEEQEPGTS